MDAASILRGQFQQSHWTLEEMVKDLTPEQAHWQPGGTAIAIGANYAHVLLGEDMVIQSMCRGQASLSDGDWSGKIGIDSPPPGMGESWDAWAKSVRVDMGALRAYAAAVHQATDDYLASVSEADLERTVDLSGIGLGEQTIGWLIANFAGTHYASHTGEIATVKGLQGLMGYPF